MKSKFHVLNWASGQYESFWGSKRPLSESAPKTGMVRRYIMSLTQKEISTPHPRFSACVNLINTHIDRQTNIFFSQWTVKPQQNSVWSSLGNKSVLYWGLGDRAVILGGVGTNEYRLVLLSQAVILLYGFILLTLRTRFSVLLLCANHELDSTSLSH